MPYRNPRGPTVGWQPSLRQRRWWAKMARCGNNFRRNYNDRFQRDEQLDDGVPDNPDDEAADGGEAEARRAAREARRAARRERRAARRAGAIEPAVPEAPDVNPDDLLDNLADAGFFDEYQNIPINPYANNALPPNIIQQDFPPQPENVVFNPLRRVRAANNPLAPRRRRRNELERLLS